MNDIIREHVQPILDVQRIAFQAGHAEGYRRGYADALAKAEQIVAEHFAKHSMPLDKAEAIMDEHYTKYPEDKPA